MLYSLLAAGSVSLISLVGALALGEVRHARTLHRLILPIAVGVFLSVAFVELIPETLEASELGGAIAILIGFLGFYLLSHFLDTYHHHHADDHDGCNTHGARKLLIGDSIHNLADGIVIATSFMIDPLVGVATTIAIALHEVPQEIAEYSVLRTAGYSPSRALWLNFMSATAVICGVLLAYLAHEYVVEYTFVLTGIAAGNLLYIATGDLLPELRESHREHFGKTFIATLMGVVLMTALIVISHEYIGGEHTQELHTEEV